MANNEMKTREQRIAKMAKYVGDYVEDEISKAEEHEAEECRSFDIYEFSIAEWIQEGIEAYESINDVQVDVFDAYN